MSDNEIDMSKWSERDIIFYNSIVQWNKEIDNKTVNEWKKIREDVEDWNEKSKEMFDNDISIPDICFKCPLTNIEDLMCYIYWTDNDYETGGDYGIPFKMNPCNVLGCYIFEIANE